MDGPRVHSQAWRMLTPAHGAMIWWTMHCSKMCLVSGSSSGASHSVGSARSESGHSESRSRQPVAMPSLSTTGAHTTKSGPSVTTISRGASVSFRFSGGYTVRHGYWRVAVVEGWLFWSRSTFHARESSSSGPNPHVCRSGPNAARAAQGVEEHPSTLSSTYRKHR